MDMCIGENLSLSIRAYLYDTTSRMRLLSWRMKTTADDTIPVHQFMAKFEI
jgi:hypothetical protein